MSKYYAVKKGRNIGIFNTWDECLESTKGFPGAIFKSFNSEEEAKAFLEDKDIYNEEISKYIDEGYAVAFSDGSFDEKLNRYSYGVVCIDRDMNETELYNFGNNPKYIDTKNIIGEILGVFNALDWAITNGYDKIKLFYDYEGLEKWATKEWNAKSETAKMYVYMLENNYKDLIKIEFMKVKGHSNNKYNEKADQLAKMALKDRVKFINTGGNWFTIPAFKKEELEAIIDLMKDDMSELNVSIVCDDNARYVTKLRLEDDEITITLYKTGNKTLMIQGNMNTLFQMFLTYINELLGINKIKTVIDKVYKKKIDNSKIIDDYKKICPSLPSDYPESCKALIQQSIINLSYYVEAVEYSQYVFPALRALEGHIKYICNKNGIIVTRTFDVFDLDKTNNIYFLTSKQKISTQTKQYIEKMYNYYATNRHTLFHIGDMIGLAVNTRTLETKKEADEIIQEVISMINEI